MHSELHETDLLTRARLSEMKQLLQEVWDLGRNIVLQWTPVQNGIEVLALPNYLILEAVAGPRQSDTYVDYIPALDGAEQAAGNRFIDELFQGEKQVDRARLAQVAALLKVEPTLISLTFTPGEEVTLDVIDAIIQRYSISYATGRAVVLFDIVHFSLLSPLEQMIQLNSLSHSVNTAHHRLMQREMDIAFARSTTGDGFYIWNRNAGVQANVNLYHFMHLVLADNAIASSRDTRNAVPRLRTAFHIGDHYEFHQSEGLSPTMDSFIVGDVTIELARMVGGTLPGQILVGDFKVEMEDDQTRARMHVDSTTFIDCTQASLESLTGMELSGDAIQSIKCYLTGAARDGGGFDITRYDIHDKHGKSRTVFNAKINIHRAHDAPIYLGTQERDLVDFGDQ